MANEIERKFLVKNMPDLSQFQSVTYERYYIFRSGAIEMRVQKKGEKYEIERKEMLSDLKAEKSKMEISKAEFEILKKLADEAILREGYFLSVDPVVSIKVYHGKYEGLKKIEVEFESELQAKEFSIPEWYGEEITDSVISRDAKLLDLKEEEFKQFIS